MDKAAAKDSRAGAQKDRNTEKRRKRTKGQRNIERKVQISKVRRNKQRRDTQESTSSLRRAIIMI